MTRRRTALPFVLLGAALVLALYAPSAAAQYSILCGGNPPPPHVNGLGQVMNDCSPLGVPGNASTYTLTLATAARAAWPYAGTDSNGMMGTGPRAAYCVARQTATACAVWAYSGPVAGYVHLNTASSQCYAPTSTDPVWK